MPTVSKQLGKRLELFRLEREMTQKQAADSIGVSHSTISRLEAGKSVGKLSKYKVTKHLDKVESGSVAA